MNIFNNNVMAHFIKILKHTFETFLLKRRTTIEQISPEPKRQRIVVEDDKERDFPEVIMEGDSILSRNLLHYQL